VIGPAVVLAFLAAGGTPDSMVRMVVRDVSADVEPESFAARPKTRRDLLSYPGAS